MAEPVNNTEMRSARELLILSHDTFVRMSVEFEQAGRKPGDMLMLAAMIMASIARASNTQLDTVVELTHGLGREITDRLPSYEEFQTIAAELRAAKGETT
jgi:hypothetical protein